MGQWWSQPPSPTPRPNATTQFSLSSLLPSALFPQRSTSTQPITAQNSTSTQPITAQNFIHQQQSNRPRRPREPFTVDGGDDDGFELGRRTRARSTFTSVEGVIFMTSYCATYSNMYYSCIIIAVPHVVVVSRDT
jgi:hypothetical protein